MSEFKERQGVEAKTQNNSAIYEQIFAWMASDQSNQKARARAPQPLACYQAKEPCAGYYDRVDSERKALNDELTRFFGPLEKEAGFIIGAYAIYGSLVKSKRKWL